MTLPMHDPDARCCKCGHEDVATIWIGDKHTDSTSWYERSKNDWPDSEFLLRRCTRCSYRWVEACDDAKKDQAA